MGVGGALEWLGCERGALGCNWVLSVVYQVGYGNSCLDCKGTCNVLGVYILAAVILEKWESLGLVNRHETSFKGGDQD